MYDHVYFFHFYVAEVVLITYDNLQQAGVSQAEESIKKELYPKREEFQWRPASILCKRFELTDPYLGKVISPLCFFSLFFLMILYSSCLC